MKYFLILFLLHGLPLLGAHRVEVSKASRECDKDSDCILVETLCSACCGYESINQKFRKEFAENYRSQCAGHKGGVCDCYSKFTEPKCVLKECKLLEKK